jgi:hypothetical protein
VPYLMHYFHAANELNEQCRGNLYKPACLVTQKTSRILHQDIFHEQNFSRTPAVHKA